MLFGTRGKNARTLQPGRTQVNYLFQQEARALAQATEQYPIVEACSRGPYLELFARGERQGWVSWGNQADDRYQPTWKTYRKHSRAQYASTFVGRSGLRLGSVVPRSGRHRLRRVLPLGTKRLESRSKEGPRTPTVPRSKTIIFGRKRHPYSLGGSKAALYKAHRLARTGPILPNASYVRPAFVSAAVTIPHSRSLNVASMPYGHR